VERRDERGEKSGQCSIAAVRNQSAGLIALLLGGLGLGAYVTRRQRRHAAEIEPADELKAALAQSRAAEAETANRTPGETQPQAAPDSAEEQEAEPDLAERRREVHDRARAAIDELS
jgi:hypothetical protein